MVTFNYMRWDLIGLINKHHTLRQVQKCLIFIQFMSMLEYCMTFHVATVIVLVINCVDCALLPVKLNQSMAPLAHVKTSHHNMDKYSR